MEPETPSHVLDIHCGDEAHVGPVTPQFGGLGLYARSAEWNSVQRLAYQRGDDDGPTAAMEVLLGLSYLHVTTEAEAQGSTN